MRVKPKLKAFVQEARNPRNELNGQNEVPHWVVQLLAAECLSRNSHDAFPIRRWTARQMRPAGVEASRIVWKQACDSIRQSRFSTQRVPSAHTDSVVFENIEFPVLWGSFVSPLSAVEIIRGVFRQWATVEDSPCVVDHFPEFKITAAVAAARSLRCFSFRLRRDAAAEPIRPSQK